MLWPGTPPFGTSASKEVAKCTTKPLNMPEHYSDNTTLLADKDFLEELRSQMHRFATLQLSDQQLAEDTVQEALIGALKNAGSFAGRAALKTWVFAILKNKIADALRQKQRLAKVISMPDDHEQDASESKLFNARGDWHKNERPALWCNPEGSMREVQFWQVFETCLNHLPGKQAKVFMMREFIQLESAEICESADITLSNLNVMLHRARIRLRECLEDHWFVEGEST